MTFPPDLPDDVSDPEIIRSHDWNAFRQVGVMQNHWDRPGWTEGRRSFHWMLTFPDAIAVHELALACQERLRRAEFDPVSLDTLHITLGRIAFTDEITRSEVETIAANAASRCKNLSAFAVHVGPLSGSRGALRFSVTPWAQQIELHQLISDATRDTLGHDKVLDTSSFRPHLSIAYCNRQVPVADLLPQVAQCRTITPVSTHISTVSLVELRRDNAAYRYKEIRQITLGH